MELRYDFDEFVNRKGTGCAKWDACEEVFGTADVLPLWVADMDFRSPPEVTEALVRRASEGLFGYTRVSPTVAQAVVDWMAKRHGWKIEPEWIVYTPGVIPGLYFALHACTHPGDSVVFQTPAYPPFFAAVRNTGCQLATSPLRFHNGHYQIDADDLALRFGERTAAFVLCNPHNPVGRVFTREELLAIGDLCQRHEDVVIVSDEIHSDIVFGQNKHIPIASLSDALAQRTITLVSPAKTFNLPGLKASAAIIPNARLRRAFVHATDACGVHGVNLFGLVAMETAYRHGEDWLEDLLAYLEGNLAYLERFLRERIRGISLARPEGTFLAWLDCRELGVDAPALKKFMIEKAKVGLNDGAAFGPGGEGFQRLNFACHRSTLEEALRRIEAAVARY